MAEDASVTFEDVRILFRNFSGRETQYNKEGDRNFSVVIPDLAIAERMIADGWNVKFLKPREEGDDPIPTLPIAVNYDRRPPTVVMITSTARTRLTEDDIDTLDWADIKTVDLSVNPYTWSVNGNSGIKAYLKALYVTVEESYLEKKYAQSHHDD